MNKVDELAKIIWDYHHMNQPLKKADAILALGSNDIRVADRAAELYFKKYAPLIIFSGKSGVLTKDIYKKTEAEVFADRAIELGVPEDKIIKECEATNTGENIEFTRRLIQKKEIPADSFIVVQKPYMERRTYATIKKVWPEMDFVVTSPQIEYDNYFNESYTKEYILNVIVGDLQRIIEYPELGFQIPQDVPEKVLRAFEELVSMGYTKHLIQK